ncbi:MAG TPA: nucleotidyltransferase family protein [Puia sp.]|jgi:molybdenum cofactor cytidylyltransferase
MVTAILLAAGSSRRMGAPNKLLLPWKGKPLVAITAENIMAAGINELLVITGHEADETAAALGHLPARIIHNPDHEKGMTSSIQTGVLAAAGQGYLICLADMALVTPDEYILLLAAFNREYSRDIQCILLPEYQGRKGNPVLFSSSWRESILQHPEEDGCRTLVRDNPQHHCRISMPTDHILQDIDTPGDYEQLLRPSV